MVVEQVNDYLRTLRTQLQSVIPVVRILVIVLSRQNVVDKCRRRHRVEQFNCGLSASQAARHQRMAINFVAEVCTTSTNL